MENWTWNINLFSSSFFRNETSLVNLQLLRNNKKVEQVVYGREYTLRADITDHDGKCRTSFIKLNVFKIYVIQIMNRANINSKNTYYILSWNIGLYQKLLTGLYFLKYLLFYIWFLLKVGKDIVAYVENHRVQNKNGSAKKTFCLITDRPTGI